MTRSSTVLERAIALGQRGELSPEVSLWTLAAGVAVLLSEDAPEHSFPEAPLVVQRDGTSLLALFTHEDMSGEFHHGRTATAVPAYEVLRRVPPGAGLVINPGQRLGLEVPPDGLHAFIRTLLGTTADGST